MRVSAQGGEAEPLGQLVADEIGRFWPQFLPDGRHYVYLSLGSRQQDQGLYVGALGSDLRRRLVATEYRAVYSPPGYLIYTNEAGLVAQPFDAARLELSGQPQPILGDEVARSAGPVAAGVAQFSVSATGVLAWIPPLREKEQLTWFDRAGRKLGTVGEPMRQYLVDLSPDEKTAAVCPGAFGTNRDIWLVSLASGASRRLTFDPHDDCSAGLLSRRERGRLLLRPPGESGALSKGGRRFGGRGTAGRIRWHWAQPRVVVGRRALPEL